MLHLCKIKIHRYTFVKTEEHFSALANGSRSFHFNHNVVVGTLTARAMGAHFPSLAPKEALKFHPDHMKSLCFAQAESEHFTSLDPSENHSLHSCKIKTHYYAFPKKLCKMKAFLSLRSCQGRAHFQQRASALPIFSTLLSFCQEVKVYSVVIIGTKSFTHILYLKQAINKLFC